MVIDPNNGIKPGSSGDQRPSQTRARDNTAPDPQSGAPNRPAARPDSVELSAQAQGMNRLEERLAELPDVNTERVESLKQAIIDGRFEVDAERIADKMLNQDELLS